MNSKFPFDATLNEIQNNPEPFIKSVFSCLESEFLFMPKGDGFIEYAIFEQGYENLKRATKAFGNFSLENIFPIILTTPIVLIVLRSILGFTPSEWAYITSQEQSIDISQGFARDIDRTIRFKPLTPIKIKDVKATRLEAMVEVACKLIVDGAPDTNADNLHRLDKADTRSGVKGISSLADMGVPYAMVLYERFLGRPFAGHRDSVSELVGDNLECAIEETLLQAGISYRKTKRAERLEGFDQTPDFVIPSEFTPQIIIEAKITEDDGTARDKVTRIQHLAELSLEGRSPDYPKFEVIACIGGRGFGVRKADMKKMLLATRGKIFTMKTLRYMVESSRLKEFRTR